jgi:predicted RNase H-like HicB family nuclease
MIKIYPAIFHKEDGAYWVEFPDLSGCLTEGATLKDAMRNAEEVLGVFIVTRIEDGLAVPDPSDIESLNAESGFTSYISTDIDKYRRKTKSVKKTLSMPQWLCEEAERQHLSLSAVLQNAIKGELGIAE